MLADANFPAASIAKHCPGGLIRMDGKPMDIDPITVISRSPGHCIPPLLKAICTLMPLDSYVDAPVRILGTNRGNCSC